MTFYRNYRAPTEHGQALIEPALSDAAVWIERNRERSRAWQVQLCGRSLQVLRDQARAELLQEAFQYTSRYREVDAPRADLPIVMAGHQPTLFHPGVWFKNFALARLANPSRGIRSANAVNLVVDNDVATSSSVRVPKVDPGTGLVHQESVLFDSFTGTGPYEQHFVHDRALFDSFDQRISEAIAPIVKRPLIRELWPVAKAAIGRCANVRCAIAQARHALEGTMGLQSFELPLSSLCRSHCFAAFSLALLSDLPRFRETYNSSVRRYRRLHGIRSKAHPVPDLGIDGEWLEAPFWLYSDQAPLRRPVWVRRRGSGIEISDHRHSGLLVDSLGHESAVEALAGRMGPDWKLRPRALITTMYARMVLSDLFIHGIGGAMYDQLGDDIAREFFAIEPANMMVVSATMQLPVSSQTSAGPTVTEVLQSLRDVRFAPERFANSARLSANLVEEKQSLLAEIPAPGHKREWHRRMESVNRRLEDELAPVRAELEQRLVAAKRNEASAAVLRSREYSFCLFDLNETQQAFERMLRQSS